MATRRLDCSTYSLGTLVGFVTMLLPCPTALIAPAALILLADRDGSQAFLTRSTYFDLPSLSTTSGTLPCHAMAHGPVNPSRQLSFDRSSFFSTSSLIANRAAYLCLDQAWSGLDQPGHIHMHG